MPHSPRASDLHRSRAPAVGNPKKKKKKAFLRLSSSLQDLSSYSTLDLEEGPVPDLHRNAAASSSPSFSKDKLPSPSRTLPRRKCAAAASLALCFISLVFLLYIFVLYLHEYRSRGAPNYYVVMDSGSTGTRIYVYESRIDPLTQKEAGGGLPISLKPLPEDMERAASGFAQTGRAYRRMETEPGLDKLLRNETGLRAAILPLVRWAEKQIPRAAHRRTYVFLYATAGVRRLPVADSGWILDSALEILKKETDFVCRRQWVKTISGMEEAYFGWIAVNYRMGILGSMKKTFGALELGGSSLQVTFKNEEPGGDGHSLSLHIGSVYHNLIAYSLPGYGLNDAFDKSVAHLLKQLLPGNNYSREDGTVEVKHPCLNQGYRESYTCSYCAWKGAPLQLVGAPQWEDCSALAKSTVNLSEWSASTDGIDCDIRPCALPDNIPRPHGHFYAMSGFVVVSGFFNLSSDATLDDLLLKGQEFCRKTWEKAKESVKPQPFIEQYCFRAPYVASLLRDGLHIRDSEVMFSSGSITWTLGVALVESGKTFSRKISLANYMTVPGSINPMFLVFISFMSLMFLCVIAFASKQLRNFFRRAYLPLFRRSNAAGSFQYFNPGETRMKTLLSPIIKGSEQSSFIMAANAKGSGGNSTQPAVPSMNPSGGVLHSFSYSNLNQIYADNRAGSSWAPHRKKTQLWSRRSQSREDLSSTLAGIHAVKE